MIDGSEKCNRQLAFELQNLHVCEKRSKLSRVDGTAWVGRERTGDRAHFSKVPKIYRLRNLLLLTFNKDTR